MIKIKHIFYFALVSVLLYSCGSDNGPSVVNFDHEAQALKDKDTIVKFLKSHYYKEDTVDSIKPLIVGKTSLFDDSRLKSKVVNEFDIDYTYYYFVKEPEGVSDKGYPTVIDSILTTYRLSSVTVSDKHSSVQDLNTPTWFNPAQIIFSGVRGWVYGFTHFKAGILKRDSSGSPINGPITYTGKGEGFFLLPSGLSYRNGGSLPNQNLLYMVKLWDFVKDTDHDLDGIASFFEDLNEDGKPWNDDTDGDRILNFIDTDDDGDGKLTKDEDANGDGDPRNDFSDPNNPTLPDYLNRDIR